MRETRETSNAFVVLDGQHGVLALAPLNGTEEGSDKRAKEGMAGYLFEIKSVLG